ncbi:MAG: histone-like nucleoid-structuring protein Lsr2 [Nocardioides sp.]|uniref:histone-like nucleoid-structuring protein Lsr2 n=1 Tax=Nocardioides nematodiphilus TaxID=2849669 RepID=UPI001CD959CC|nr:Lsr2 family protein [Nocardioides nematodiphilus]MCA1981609.1 Lsr2 family protein [Nocardioides nematodiphilus]
MAQKVQIVLEDDIDGGEATQTVTFSLDGTHYEIDLNDGNADRLRSALAPFVGYGRKVTNGAARRGAGRRAASPAIGGASAKEIREWAHANGHAVPERGRIPADVRSAYEAAN